MNIYLDLVREAALVLPEAHERSSYGTPGFRVGKTLFARLWEDGEVLVARVNMNEREILLAADPDVFFLTEHYRGYPWVLVRLPKVEPEQLKTILRRAWREAAPKRLLAGDFPADLTPRGD
jgi:hypothetical protein